MSRVVKKKDLSKYQKYVEEKVKPIADIIGIKLAPIEDMLAVYPDEILGWDFDNFEEDLRHLSKNKKRILYGNYTVQKLIKAFKSHDWKCISDIYGHNGLSRGYVCRTCKRKVDLPEPDFDQETRKEYHSDEFIIAYHQIYGKQKRFGGRITKCKGKKK